MLSSESNSSNAPTFEVFWTRFPRWKMWRFITYVICLTLLSFLVAFLFAGAARNKHDCTADISNTILRCKIESVDVECPSDDADTQCILAFDNPNATEGCATTVDPRCPTDNNKCVSYSYREDTGTCRKETVPDGKDCNSRCFFGGGGEGPTSGCLDGECVPYGKESCVGWCAEGFPSSVDSNCVDRMDQMFYDWALPAAGQYHRQQPGPGNCGGDPPDLIKYGSALMHTMCAQNRCVWYTTATRPILIGSDGSPFRFVVSNYDAHYNDDELEFAEEYLDSAGMAGLDLKYYLPDRCGEQMRDICMSRVKPEWRECMDVSYGCFPRLEMDFGAIEGGFFNMVQALGVSTGCIYSAKCAAHMEEYPMTTGPFENTNPFADGNWGHEAPGFASYYLMQKKMFRAQEYPPSSDPVSSYYLNMSIVPFMRNYMYAAGDDDGIDGSYPGAYGGDDY